MRWYFCRTSAHMRNRFGAESLSADSQSFENLAAFFFVLGELQFSTMVNQNSSIHFRYD